MKTCRSAVKLRERSEPRHPRRAVDAISSPTGEVCS
jgi:hypothetical protein